MWGRRQDPGPTTESHCGNTNDKHPASQCTRHSVHHICFTFSPGSPFTCLSSLRIFPCAFCHVYRTFPGTRKARTCFHSWSHRDPVVHPPFPLPVEIRNQWVALWPCVFARGELFSGVFMLCRKFDKSESVSSHPEDRKRDLSPTLALLFHMSSCIFDL